MHLLGDMLWLLWYVLSVELQTAAFQATNASLSILHLSCCPAYTAPFKKCPTHLPWLRRCQTVMGPKTDSTTVRLFSESPLTWTKAPRSLRPARSALHWSYVISPCWSSGPSSSEGMGVICRAREPCIMIYGIRSNRSYSARPQSEEQLNSQWLSTSWGLALRP